MERPFGDDPTTSAAGFGAQFHHMVGFLHGVHVMFHHENRVAPVGKGPQVFQELGVIRGMEPYGGLIENVADPAEG